MLHSRVIQRVDRSSFWSLPSPQTDQGRRRRTGVEIEFADLTEEEAARIVHRLWNGQVDRSEPHRLRVHDTDIGEVKVLLDTALVKLGGTPVTEAALDISRAVIPVEIVTPPLSPDDLPKVDQLVKALRSAGAAGTRESFAYGFGAHLNIELPALDAASIIPPLRAYALLEDWLRAADPLDPARRLLPFVDAYPRAFVDLLASEAADWTLEDLARAYLSHTPTRNRGLDALPLLEHLFPEVVRRVLGDAAKGPRPAWHYRLPEARVDEADWSIAYEWNRWCMVERVAADTDLLEALAADWQVYREAFTTMRGDWELAVEEKLWDARIWT